MKLRFPYWWFCRRRNPAAEFQYSPYVVKRYALSDARLKEGKVVAPCPDSAHGPTGEQAVGWIYELLGVLDSKALALMRLNGVMLAAAAFLLNPEYGSSRFVSVFVASAGIGSTLSIACCLLVVSVDWPFLGLVTPKPQIDLDFSEELFHLQQVANFRQFLYRIA